MEFLKSAVASAISKGPLGAYSVGDQIHIDGSIWTLNNSIKREDRSKCSIFTFNIYLYKHTLPLAKNAVHKSRTLHHPGMIKVLETIETDTHIYLVTERVIPLTWYTGRRSLPEDTLKWGLWNVAKTVKFINDEASSVHGCIRASSVYVNDSGEWKLDGFELLSSMKDEEAVIYTYSSLVPGSGRFFPPEVVKAGWSTIKRNPLSAVDSYGFGTLVSEVFNGPISGTEIPIGDVPPTMQKDFKRLIAPNPKLRLSVAHFLDQGRRNGGFFQSSLVNLTEGLEKLGLKTEAERDKFSSEVIEIADQVPEEYLKQRILPELLRSVEYGDGGPKVFSAVLEIATKLTSDEYDTHITPVLIRLFSSPDRAIRVCLLDNLPRMVDHLPPKIVNDKIFPSLTTGFTDVAPVIREQTVKSVLVIITKLSDRVVNGELLKYLAKTLNDEQPGIRTNTTICLGKIAKHLGPNTASKVLVAAFTRSLKDPFVHARNAGLLALAVTSEMYSENDCANRILPAICPSLLDKEKLVRDQASKTMETFLIRIRKHAETLPETVLPQASASDITANLAQAPRMSAASNEAGWAGWAISSFTNKLGTAKGEIQAKANGTIDTTRPTGNAAATYGSRNGRPLSSSSAILSPPLSRTTTNSTKLVPSIDATETNEDATAWDNQENGDWGEEDTGQGDDMWGAMVDEEGDSFFDAPPESVSKSQAHEKPKTEVKASHFDDKGEPDFAGWLKAQQNQKTSASKALPKGLGAKIAVGNSSTSAPTKVPQASRTGGAASTGFPAKKAAVDGAKLAPADASSSKTQPSVNKQDEVEEDEAWGAWD